MASQNIVKLRIPKQELDHSSYFDCNEKSVQLWLDELPMTNLGETARALYKALQELNRVHMPAALRVSLLEKLRSALYYVSRSLSKHYLNQPIVLPHRAEKIADLAYAIHQQLAFGYSIASAHATSSGTGAVFGKPDLLIAKAVHRAITDHTLNIVRQFQLYEPVSAGQWRDLHQLYCLAKLHNILTVKVEDLEYCDSTLENCYIRALLLGCSRPNQLRQEDLAEIFNPLADWAQMCRLTGVDTTSLFVVDPNADKPAVYRELFETASNDRWLSLDTKTLVNYFEELNEKVDHCARKTTVGEYQISTDVLGHLAQAWGVVSKRALMRVEATDELRICVGLNATHHFVSGEISFESLVEEHGTKAISMQNTNPFMKKPSTPVRRKDVWDSPYETKFGQTDVSLESIDYQIRHHDESQTSTIKEKYPCHNARLINSSTQGYCVDWSHDKPAHIKTGEIVGIKQPNNHYWCIGVIRWVSHGDKQTQLGVELISSSASPYGARIVSSKGGPAKFARVLVLPEVHTSNQPVTVLTPRVPFRTGQKIVLNQRGKEIQVTLEKKLNDTGAYSQFEFRKMTSKLQGKSAEDTDGGNDGHFDSLWTSL